MLFEISELFTTYDRTAVFHTSATLLSAQPILLHSTGYKIRVWAISDMLNLADDENEHVDEHEGHTTEKKRERHKLLFTRLAFIVFCLLRAGSHIDVSLLSTSYRVEHRQCYGWWSQPI